MSVWISSQKFNVKESDAFNCRGTKNFFPEISVYIQHVDFLKETCL